MGERGHRMTVTGVTAMVVCVLSLSACSAGGYRPSMSQEPPSATRSAVESSPTRLGGAVRRALPRRTDARGIAFDEVSAIREATAITTIGVRTAGSAKERRAASHIAARLRSFGLTPRYQYFSLPNGRRSVNVLASVRGLDDSRAILLGGHIDTKPPSPGANDNASGCGVLLELASELADSPPPYTVDLIFWGAEEAVFGSPDIHHLGSRHHAKSLSATRRDRYVGVVSVDMIGRGSTFLVRSMGKGPATMTRLMLDDAASYRMPLRYRRDPGKTGWSDHEAYELRGMPVAWLEWPEDPKYHTGGDVAARLRRRPVRLTGELVTRFVYRLDESRIASLDAR